MKLWLLPCVLILATSCSHGGTKSETGSQPAAAPAKTAAAPTAAATAPKGHKTVKAKITSNDTAAADHTTCKSGTDERTIEIVTKGEGCTVEYTKAQEKKEIATAEHETGHCKEVAQKVRGHLEGAGFTCN